jgi:hypothetical protein
MNEQRPDDWLKILTTLSAMRGAGAESTVQAHEQIGPRSRAALPMMHAALVSTAFVAVVGGLALFAGGVFRLLGWNLAPGQELAALVAFAGLVVAVTALVRYGLQVSEGAGQVFLVVFVVMFLGVATLSAALSAHEMGTWELGKLVLGAALVLGGLALGYNQVLDLVNPYWRRSPYETEISRLLPYILNLAGGEAPGVEERRATDYTVVANGRHVAGPRPAPERVTIDPEQGNDIWFGLYVTGLRDLSYRTIAMKPAPLLPFAERDRMGRPRQLRLRERTIRRLLERGARRGWWEAPGPGQVAELRLSRREIREEALRMWREVMGDAPPPDFWVNRAYVTERAL